jgi:DNA-binding NarL/FixJ family response regulator
MNSPHDLTDDQVAVIRLIAVGRSDQQIARELSVSVSTVQRRLRSAAEQVGATSRVQLVAKAAQLGLLGERTEVDENASRGGEGRGEM